MSKQMDPGSFIAELIDAGGSVTHESPTPRQRKRNRQLIYAALTGGHVPVGKKLTYSGRDSGPMTISLIDPPAERAKLERITVAVPERVTSYHPALTATVTALKTAPQDDRGRYWLRGHGLVSMNVSRQHQRRALRLIHALYLGAQEHGYTVGPAQADSRNVAHRREVPVGIFVGRDGDSWEIRIVEKTSPVPHEPTKKELEEQRRWSWTRIPDNDYIPNGQLEIRIEGYDAGLRSRFADGSKSTLDTKIGDVVRALDDRVRQRQQKLDIERSLDDQYAQTRIPAIAAASERFVQDQLTEQLNRDLDAFALASRMRALAAAVESHHPDNTAWIEFIQAQADAHDPTPRSAAMPHVGQPTDADLEPYLRAWPVRRPWGWEPDNSSA